ncbi:hypothetical protein RB195_021832 [Necator americanus]|uniref:Secreted protein n=1 Tax=Necator americanus TaxID=51031 RepID=A0ABR1ECU3_NECAM
MTAPSVVVLEVLCFLFVASAANPSNKPTHEPCFQHEQPGRTLMRQRMFLVLMRASYGGLEDYRCSLEECAIAFLKNPGDKHKVICNGTAVTIKDYKSKKSGSGKPMEIFQEGVKQWKITADRSYGPYGCSFRRDKENIHFACVFHSGDF